MAQETVDFGIKKCGLPKIKCVTKNLRIHGYQPTTDYSNCRYVYGSDLEKIVALQNQKSEYAEKLHSVFDITVAEIIWAVREEMAMTVEDVLARRVRALYFNAQKSMEIAPKVAQIMAKELNKDEAWITEQVKEYNLLAKNYFISY